MTDKTSERGDAANPTVQAGVREELLMSEGVGGMPDLPSEERATVGDVDGDNIEDGEELD